MDSQLKSYKRRLNDSTNALLDNYNAIISNLKIDDETRLTATNQSFQDSYEVSVSFQDSYEVSVSFQDSYEVSVSFQDSYEVRVSFQDSYEVSVSVFLLSD